MPQGRFRTEHNALHGMPELLCQQVHPEEKRDRQADNEKEGGVIEHSRQTYRRERSICALVEFIISNPDAKLEVACSSEKEAEEIMKEVKRRISGMVMA